jgi:hypothetical protein
MATGDTYFTTTVAQSHGIPSAVPAAAVAGRVDGLSNSSSIQCPECDGSFAGPSVGEPGVAVVDTRGETLDEWHVGDRCDDHAETALPDEATHVVRYSVEDGDDPVFWRRRAVGGPEAVQRL